MQDFGFSQFHIPLRYQRKPPQHAYSEGYLYPSLEVGGERDRIRTCDPVIKSHLLYQLSYAPTVALWRSQVTVGKLKSLAIVLPKA